MKTKIGNVYLRIRYTRRSDPVILAVLLILALATAVFLATLAWGPGKAAADTPAAPAASADRRKYYLTLEGDNDGHDALTACAPGYHMASLWEILDPSNLEYNTDLGITLADSGAGPPLMYGWIRTGWDSETTTGIPGQDNCAAWTSDDSAHNGTVAWLSGYWELDTEDIHVWEVGTTTCNDSAWVWCVEDYGSYTYLPLVVKD